MTRLILILMLVIVIESESRESHAGPFSRPRRWLEAPDHARFSQRRNGRHYRYFAGRELHRGHNYTAVIRDKNNTTGVALVEAYQLQNLFWSTRARLVDYLLQAIC